MRRRDARTRPTSTFAVPTFPAAKPTPTLAPAPTPFKPSEESIIVDDKPATTGETEADRLLRALETHDIDTILEFAAYRQQGCGSSILPDCPPSAPDAPRNLQYADGFVVRGCNQGTDEQTIVWRDDAAQLRKWFELALRDAPRSFIFAVKRYPFSKAGDLHYAIGLGAGATPRPDAAATYWQAGPDTKLETLRFDCRNRGIAAYFGGDANFSHYLVPPRVYCASGEAIARIEVTQRLYGGTYPELRGAALTADGERSGRTVLVAIRRPGAGGNDE
jgi:hypothetical protein